MVTLINRPLLTLCVVLIAFAVSACHGSTNNSPSLTPTETVVLPKSIDPSQRPHKLRRGTAVYVFIPAQFEWTTVINGSRTLHIITLPDLKSVSKQNGMTIAVTTTGARRVFPLNAVQVKSTERELGFVAPGAPVPDILRGRKPDYIVP